MVAILAETGPGVAVASSPWVMVVGCVFLGLAILFLMGLAVMAVAGREVPPTSRPLILIIVSLSLGAAFGFLGTYGTLSGNIPLPFASSHPLDFTIGGGAAVALITWLIGHQLYVRSARKSDTPNQDPEELSAAYDEGTPLSEAIKNFCKSRQPQSFGVVFQPDEQRFQKRKIAAGEVRGKTVVEVVKRLTTHLAQGSSAISVTVTKPDHADMLFVKDNDS